MTGGGRGIGAATARALAEAGARVIVSARSTGEIERVAAELRGSGHEAWAVPCDVTDESRVAALAGEAAELLGRVDILVSNAGMAASAPLKRLTLEEWNRVFAVNVTGVFLCARAFLEPMVEAGWGRIVNIASIAGKVGHPYITHYVASKHAVVGFTRALAVEVAAKGVTVNAVCPGYVDTPMTDASVANMMEKTGMSQAESRRWLEDLSPQKRLMRPEEIAFQVVSLCHPEAAGVNGQSVVVDGGTVQS